MIPVKISNNFKRQARNSIFSIVLFIIVYLILFILSIGLLIGCCYGAFYLIAIKPSFISIMIGVGLVAVGVFIVYFMIKFMFTKDKTDYSHLTEITEENEPELFKMLQELVIEIGTKFPKKVFISHEVNASVFYDSSFWSMFFPIKKNLHIGLGLTNTLTVSELKGILAHEFGHFSQKSMKVGSYVYNVNKVIHNMLFDNDSYNSTISTWANSSGYFVLLIQLAIQYNRFVQFILRYMYKIVNVNYMGLSREMEFHADAIAANVVGSDPMISSMLRMDLASQSQNTVLNYYDENIKNNITTDNIFPQQKFALNFIAKNNNINIIHDLPNVTLASSERFNKSKLVIQDQWSSHPSTEDRVAAFIKLNIPSVKIDNTSANTLFRNIKETQQKISKKLMSTIQYEKEPEFDSLETFSNSIAEKYNEIKFPEIYNSYYDNHNISTININEQTNLIEPIEFETLFNNDKTELIYLNLAQNNDSETLKSISENSYDLKSFDYDGKKHKVKDALQIHEKIKIEIEKNTKLIEENDILIFKFFYQKAHLNSKSELLIKLYYELFEIDRLHDIKSKIYLDMTNGFSFAFQVLKIDLIKSNLSEFYDIEKRFKVELNSILSDPLYEETISTDIRKLFEDYIKNDLMYFKNEKYVNDEIQQKETVLSNYLFILQQTYFLKKKKLLDFQATLL